jgi:hypothetical protein
MTIARTAAGPSSACPPLLCSPHPCVSSPPRLLQEANVPRFLSEDLPLFHDIITDLYPDVSLPPTTDYAQLEHAAAYELTTANLQPTSTFVAKLVELQQTLKVRFGVMLVGVAGGGKSTALSTLRDALSALRRGGSLDEAHQIVHTVTFNPKYVCFSSLLFCCSSAPLCFCSLCSLCSPLFSCSSFLSPPATGASRSASSTVRDSSTCCCLLCCCFALLLLSFAVALLCFTASSTRQDESSPPFP